MKKRRRNAKTLSATFPGAGAEGLIETTDKEGLIQTVSQRETACLSRLNCIEKYARIMSDKLPCWQDHEDLRQDACVDFFRRNTYLYSSTSYVQGIVAENRRDILLTAKHSYIAERVYLGEEKMAEEKQEEIERLTPLPMWQRLQICLDVTVSYLTIQIETAAAA